ncbi:hypothetical protein L7F22_048414 [Adiantum nelumboides]|nr:hypothetical protein [Adiantum nelumboides]
MGLLSGKYCGKDGGPSNARLNLYRGQYAEAECRYNLSKPNVMPAVKAYVKIAQQYNVSPVALAIVHYGFAGTKEKQKLDGAAKTAAGKPGADDHHVNTALQGHPLPLTEELSSSCDGNGLQDVAEHVAATSSAASMETFPPQDNHQLPRGSASRWFAETHRRHTRALSVHVANKGPS